MNETTKNDERFEDQLGRLEEIVARLEDESVGLEEALELFEGGMELARRCRDRLEEVEQRVSQLLEIEDGDADEEAEPPEEEPS
ncbi:MAG: exodeoxyribonuclease VII small subunit [Acidobacteria bacterium]|nr:exodeoxyribonuclease VII small subunit [Acidobacteriota bacterium]